MGEERRVGAVAAVSAETRMRNKQRKTEYTLDYAFSTLIRFFIAFFFSSLSIFSSIFAFFSGDIRSTRSLSSLIFCSFIACILY